MHIILVAAWQFVTISLARSNEPLIPLEVSPSACRQQLHLRLHCCSAAAEICTVPGRHILEIRSNTPLCPDRVPIVSSPHPTNEQIYEGVAASS
jgi:hypothetical protein